VLAVTWGCLLIFKLKEKIRNIFFIITAVFLCAGFRLYNKNQPWKSLSSTPVAATKLFVIYENATQLLENDLPASDPLFGTPTITVTQAMDSVFADYNSIAGAYVTLVDSSDVDFNPTNAERRTITVLNRGTNGVQGGDAQFESDGGGITACIISLTDPMYDNAKIYVRVATHEIGHCLGLTHPQEITKSVMSYFSDDSVYRLQTDDKMGLLFLYPTNPGASNEDPTFGMTCSKR